MKNRLLIAAIVFTSVVVSGEPAGRGQASLLVLLDLSGSMARHRVKLAEIGNIVRTTMEAATCDIQVAVGNIGYEGVGQADHFTPWAEPGGDPWLSMVDPGAPQLIQQRIGFPHETVFPTLSDGGDPLSLPSGGKEITYSSVVESLRHNRDQIVDSEVVGTVLFTDAAPGYELYSPEDAASQIRSILGGTPFATANIVHNFHPAMTIDRGCTPDFKSVKIPGNIWETSRWNSPHLTAISEFNDIFYGQQIDVCASSYVQRLQRFLYELLVMGNCLPLS